ncbi:FAD-dependent monooxygenase [Acinetobacter higginsii]|uniref:FAD-dependent monooxygenase n=1 Tax=Acinetobacter higginsii TaxID=70347 RepID=UPI001F4B7DC5|nr:FAD-dependent monooxygenase [Acinetobacter higginsii]MCH7297005.1 tryptophan 7-halogenase [Acinetobacter higginsii]
MNNLKVDVCIAGHGPAGLIAARQLALAGLSVCTIDNPSHKVHKFGETLPGSAIRLLTKLGLQSIIKHLQTEQHANGYYSPRVGGNMSFWGSESPIISDALHDPYGFGLRIDRQKFDMLLAQHAHVEGIVKFSANILDLKKDRNIWNIQLECGKSIATKWIVDATGRSAKIIRLLGIQRHRGVPLVALYRTFKPEKSISLSKTIISSHKNGWLYAGKISEQKWVLGYHTIPKTAAALHNYPIHWDEIIKTNTIIPELFGELEFGKNICCHDVRSVWLKQGLGEGWIACGDALLAFDPIAGQGLFNAIYTAMKAAETIVQYDQNKDAHQHYLAETHNIIRIYENRRYSLYKQEQRWLNSPFWKAHQMTTG